MVRNGLQWAENLIMNFFLKRERGAFQMELAVLTGSIYTSPMDAREAAQV